MISDKTCVILELVVILMAEVVVVMRRGIMVNEVILY